MSQHLGPFLRSPCQRKAFLEAPRDDHFVERRCRAEISQNRDVVMGEVAGSIF